METDKKKIAISCVDSTVDHRSPAQIMGVGHFPECTGRGTALGEALQCEAQRSYAQRRNCADSCRGGFALVHWVCKGVAYSGLSFLRRRKGAVGICAAENRLQGATH